MSEFKCGIGYSTELPVGDVHDWLDANCAGNFHVQLADINADTGTKKVEIFFENESDRDNFRKLFREFEKQKKVADELAADRADQPEKPKGKGLFGMLRPDKG